MGQLRTSDGDYSQEVVLVDDAGVQVGTKLSPINSSDYWLTHAISVIESTYGDVVSTEDKLKDLINFGHNQLVGTSHTTIMTLPAGILNETFVSTNIINKVSSSSASDTYSLTVEGHTISGGVFTFVTQTVTLTGQTAVTLATPLARVSRTVNNGAVDSVGNIYVHETDTLTAGVPDTDTKVHLIQQAGVNNSEKASTTVSNDDYLILTSFYGDCLDKVASFASIHLEVRNAGGVFVNKVDISANTGGRGDHAFKPYLIVPKNADVRLRAIADGVNTDISGGFQGIFAKVI